MDVGPQVALRNAGDLLSLATDKGYRNMASVENYVSKAFGR